MRAPQGGLRTVEAMTNATSAATRLGAITRLALLCSDGAVAAFSRSQGRWVLDARGISGAVQVSFDAPAGWTPAGLTNLLGMRSLGPDRLELRFAGPDAVSTVVVSGHRLET